MKITMKKNEIEKQIEDLEKKLKDIEQSAAFKQEIALRKAVARFLQKHRCSRKDLIEILEKESSNPLRGKGTPKKSTRKRRALKIYINPETGERVETRGGNHRVLKEWKKNYSLHNVDEWLSEVRP